MMFSDGVDFGFAGGVDKTVHQFKAQQAHQHGENKYQGFRLAIGHGDQRWAGAKTRLAPASTKHQTTDH